jgi:large subunit ribosomal protein L5
MKKLKKYLGKDKLNQLMTELSLDNLLAVPKPKKVIVNMGIGGYGKDKEALKELKDQISKITGQKPIETKSKQSVSAFEVVEGQVVGLQATLRGQRMYDFITKVIQIILPSWKDFKGIAMKSVTDQGDLTVGLPDNVYFPEINYEKTNIVNGLSFTIVTTADNRDDGFILFQKLGFIFESEEARKAREEIEEKRKEEKRALAERMKSYQEMAKAPTSAEEEPVEDSS